MRVIVLIISVFIYSYNLNAQVGIGTANTTVSLEIKEKKENGLNQVSINDGLMIPTVTKQELASKALNTYNYNVLGVLVFVNNVSEPLSGPSLSQVTNITKPGYYYFGENNVWVATEGDLTPDAWKNDYINNRIELSSKSNDTPRDLNTQMVINDSGFVGLNNVNPQKRLDINATLNNTTTDYVRISNLKEIEANTPSSTLVIDSDGNVYKNDVENLNGQIMRIPISGFTIGTSSASQGSIRMDFNVNSNSPASFQNGNRVCNNNFINTINGINNSNLITEVITVGGLGTIPRTTERIKLPKGVYKVQIRLNGYYTNPTNASNGTTILKLAVGNKEFSVHNYHDLVVGPNLLTSMVFTDYINLNQDDFIDFLMDNWNSKTFEIIKDIDVNGKKVLKSMVLIERLR